ncbi:telomere-protecting terminal protein Tpg [Kitasatospora sp. KL5]|uniref:telomere-protecting terminal protein Tpg n=1 Tax=Kitasatospora sp. KL5 TaxID=3425125 RepID=UPI003D6F8025
MTTVDHIDDALARATRDHVRRPIPPTTCSRVKYFLGRAEAADRRAIRGTDQHPATAAELARRAADRLGVAPRTVERWRDKKTKHPKPAAAKALEDAVRRTWQPAVRAQIRRRAADAGLTIETRATFGYTVGEDTTDQARLRRLTLQVPPQHARRLLDAQNRGAGEAELRQITAALFQELHFQDGGRRARELEVEFHDIVYMDVEFHI